MTLSKSSCYAVLYLFRRTLQKLDAGEQTWQEADRLCGDKDAIIAIPNDHIEDRFLHDMALKENGNIWLGIRENVRSWN
jgi:hypothetical protein